MESHTNTTIGVVDIDQPHPTYICVVQHIISTPVYLGWSGYFRSGPLHVRGVLHPLHVVVDM